jgi:hypothetical protein
MLSFEGYRGRMPHDFARCTGIDGRPERDTLKSDDPKKIARSRKASVEYINRAGKNLSAEEHETSEAAKPELRALFGR